MAMLFTGLDFGIFFGSHKYAKSDDDINLRAVYQHVRTQSLPVASESSMMCTCTLFWHLTVPINIYDIIGFPRC